jgi:hypothetical protein
LAVNLVPVPFSPEKISALVVGGGKIPKPKSVACTKDNPKN